MTVWLNNLFVHHFFFFFFYGIRGAADEGKKATIYKSEKRGELTKQGYVIQGSSGDQWSDLMGFALANQSFKLPNPMYYIP